MHAAKSNMHECTHLYCFCLLFCVAGDAAEEMNSIVTLLFQLFFRTNAAPTLKGCTAHKLYQILQAEQSATTAMHKSSPRSSTATTLLETHLDSVLQAIQQGHPEFTSLVLANKTLCSVKSATIEKNLPKMIESMGFAACECVILGLVEVEPSKLLPALPALVQELHNPHIPVGQKVTLLGVLLSVVLAQGAAPLVPFLENMGEACRDVPELYIPLFKVLTTVAIGSPEEVTLKALVLVSTIAKNAHYKSPSMQAAILDCVNILKDQCKYSNLFHSDTLHVFEAFSLHNQTAYKNIILWNSGKSAKKGNNSDFILNAGKVTNDAASPAGGIRSWFGSPKKAKNGSSGSSSNSNANTPTHAAHVQYSAEVRGPESVHSPHGHNITHNGMPSPSMQSAPYVPHSPYSTPSKGNSIAPSPHSQNLALMQQQLYAQQQQLQHQMLLVQQMQIQEQLAQFQPLGNVGEAGGSISNIYGSHSLEGGAGGVSGQLSQSPTLLPPNISTPNYAQSPNYNHNPYILGVQSLSQPRALNMSPPPPQYPLNTHQMYSPDSYIHSPVNNAYNKNYSAPVGNNKAK